MDPPTDSCASPGYAVRPAERAEVGVAREQDARQDRNGQRLKTRSMPWEPGIDGESCNRDRWTALSQPGGIDYGDESVHGYSPFPFALFRFLSVREADTAGPFPTLCLHCGNGQRPRAPDSPVIRRPPSLVRNPRVLIRRSNHMRTHRIIMLALADGVGDAPAARAFQTLDDPIPTPDPPGPDPGQARTGGDRSRRPDLSDPATSPFRGRGMATTA